MKHLVNLLAVFVCLSAWATAQPNAADNNVQDEIRNLEQRWLDAAAVPDLPALRNMFATDFMGTAFGPRVLTKLDIVPPDGTAANHLPKSKLASSTVRVFGNTAVLMGVVEPEDSQESGFQVTTVFQKYPQGWQIIAIHMSAAQK